MGNKIDRNQEGTYAIAKKYYLFTLAKSKLNFTKAEKLNNVPQDKSGFGSLVIRGDGLQDNLDWKIRIETYLDERKDTYFWAKELLE